MAWIRSPLPPRCPSLALSVGSDPDALSLVRGTNVFRSQHSPLRIEPHRGQVSENSAEPPRSKNWAVLHEDVLRSYLANDPGHFAPESAGLPVDARSTTGRADVCAWESSADNVNGAVPRPPVECFDVVPDREARENAVALPGEQYRTAIGIKLDSADGAPAREDSSQNASSCSCK